MLKELIEFSSRRPILSTIFISLMSSTVVSEYFYYRSNDHFLIPEIIRQGARKITGKL